MTSEPSITLNIVTATCAGVVGLSFFCHWLDGANRFFLYFGAAFWLLALSWGLQVTFYPTDELRPYLCIVRAIASLLGAGLLFWQWRAQRPPLLLWSGIAFLVLAIDDVMVFVDAMATPAVDLAVPWNPVGTIVMTGMATGLAREWRA